jgi:hypothetical protein
LSCLGNYIELAFILDVLRLAMIKKWKKKLSYDEMKITLVALLYLFFGITYNVNNLIMEVKLSLLLSLALSMQCLNLT